MNITFAADYLEQSHNQQRTEDVLMLEEITVTATRQRRSGIEVPQDITIVSREEVDRQVAAVLPDYLRGKEGVYIQQTTPGQASPTVRGLMGSEILVLVDGMRLNNALFRPAPNQYLALVDPNIVDHLEVVHGPGSTLYGSDAMGGVINVLTRTPHFTSTEWQTHGRLLGQYGSADTSGATRMAIEGGKQGIGLSAGLSYRNAGNLRGGGDIGVQSPSAWSYFAADGALSVEGNNQDLLLTFQYLQQPKTPRYDELVAGFGQSEPSSAVFFFEPNDRLFAHGRYRRFRPLPYVDRLDLNIALQEINDDRRTREFGSTEEFRERNHSRLLNGTFQLTSEWPDWMTLTYGGEFYLDYVTSSRSAQDSATGVSSVAQSRFANGSTFNSYALYVQSEMRILPRLTLVGGARVNYFDESIPAADRGVGVDLQFLPITGNIGVVYKLTEEVNLVSNLSRGFRIPNVFDLSTLGPRPGNRFNLPSSNLGPEQIYSVDSGIKMSTSRFAGEVFGFYSILPDKISAQPTGAFTPEGREIVQSANSDRVVIWGVEAGGTIRINPKWQAQSSLSFTCGEETLANRQKTPAERIPPFNGRVSVVYRPSDRVWFEPFVRFAGRQDRLNDRDRSDPRIDPNGTPGWMTLNFRSGWEISRNFLARVAVENILNKAYREHGSGIDAPGINVIASLEALF
jgi:hemoglobin/transferrin/lactoferrin receptor protein